MTQKPISSHSFSTIRAKGNQCDLSLKHICTTSGSAVSIASKLVHTALETSLQERSQELLAYRSRANSTLTKLWVPGKTNRHQRFSPPTLDFSTRTKRTCAVDHHRKKTPSSHTCSLEAFPLQSGSDVKPRREAELPDQRHNCCSLANHRRNLSAVELRFLEDRAKTGPPSI